ncbi:MAG: P63C domain-containing protein [Planctomycetaceae bacterium]|nr:P63C domain-containing protein [Planctomycetaceae bacterium]
MGVKITNDLVYRRLEPNILNQLQKLNPRDEAGRRKNKHHQWLTEDVGHPKLREHITSVVTLMRASPNWRNFQGLINRALPPQTPI